MGDAPAKPDKAQQQDGDSNRFVKLVIGAMTRKYAARTPDVNDRRTRGRVMQRATMRVCVAA